MVKRFQLILSILLLFSITAYGQYGFEWIKPYQPYFKFKVVNTGLYRIDATTLTNSGINLSGVNPKRFQVFRNGVEQPIFIHGQSDSVFDVQDFIEFLGERNDGKLDSQLYTNSSWQPHQYASMYSDTAIYFLTILPDTTVLTGLRYIQTTASNFGSFTPEAYVMQELKTFPTEEYLYGQDLAGPSSDVRYNQSDYTDGEGWASIRLGLGGQRNYPHPTLFKYASGPAPTIEVKVVGASNAANVTINHHVRLLIGTEANPFTLLDDKTFSAFQVVKFTPTLTTSMIGNSNTIIAMQVINDLGALADFSSLSYIKLTYARQLTLGTATKLQFKAVHQQGAVKSRILFSLYGNGTFTSPIVYDLTARQRVYAQYATQTVNALIDNDGKPHQIWLSDSSEILPILSLQPVQFPVIDASTSPEFLIISNEELAQATQDYAAYRSNKYTVLTVTSNQLYDYYFYGNQHPLAVRRFAKHLLQQAPQAPRFLLLAGRGYQTDLIKVAGNWAKNLVPSIGVPSSDIMFTAGINGNGSYGEISTGRVAATTNTELSNYLQKLIDYETASDSILAWRKNVIHVTGGEGLNEQLSFINQFKHNEQVIENKYFGATVQTFSKNVSEPQQSDMREQILNAQNNGASMLSFYGHASLTVLDVDIGNITDLQNARKYPLYYFSGCNVGNANAEDPANSGDVYAKTYLCTPNKGAIGWLAHTNFSFTGNLNALQNSFYEKLSFSNYGQPIGDIIQHVTQGISSTDPITRSHNMQWLYQGDPATVIYSPALPDYQLLPQNIFVATANPSTQLDSFRLGIIVSNIAKATDDSVEITISRKLPNNTILTIGPIKFRHVYYKDTFYVSMFSKDPSMVGNNVFDVSINKFSGPVESNIFNNNVSYTYFLPGIGLQLIEPNPYAIIADDSIAITVQSNNLFSLDNEYIIELDTTNAFNSPRYQTSGILKANALASWKVVLIGTDTQPYYWRARLNLPVDQGGGWNDGSFTHIPNGNTGWMQTGFYQYRDGSQQSGLLLDNGNQQLRFRRTYNDLIVKTARWKHGGLGILDPMALTTQVGTCISGGIVCILYDKNTLEPFVSSKFPLNCSVSISFGHKFYTFDTRTLGGQQELIRFIDSVDNGNYVAMYSYYDSGSPNWTPQFRSALSRLGSLSTASINNYYSAFVMMGEKGASAGTILEDTIFNNTYNSPNANDTNYAEVDVLLEGDWFTGSMTSKPIGPVKQWGNFGFQFNSIEQSATDRNIVSLVAISTSGEDTLIQTVSQSGLYSLSQLDAQKYPYVKLSVVFYDTINRTPNQFGYWKVDYTEPTEGTIDLNSQFSFYNNTLQQGDSLRFTIPFKNISNSVYDSVPVEYKIIGEDRTVKRILNEVYPSVNPNESVLLSHKIGTLNLEGKNQLVVTVNPLASIPEVTMVNNVFNQSFEVKVDHKNPLMDVTFDGFRIMNGDFVSPTTTVQIVSKDDNEYKLQTDTSTFKVYLKTPRSSDYELIPMNDRRLFFHPASAQNNKASLEFKPDRMEDGLYMIKVISQDASGNTAGNSFYEIEFNVINESTITNFFPYPNPFTTSLRFVFTLTGDSPPDELLIRIMTITGKVVREISKEEFGVIKIGNNISEFAWDGTDNYGDRMANGVYLYQVLTRIKGEGIKKRDTAADKFVTHSTGKIYMLK